MKVRALEPAFIDNMLRQPGEVFDFTLPRGEQLPAHLVRAGRADPDEEQEEGSGE